MNLFGKRILVAGLGRSGLATIKMLLSIGAEVGAYDGKKKEDLPEESIRFLLDLNIPLYLSKDPENLSAFEFLILSPGIPLDIPLVEEAKQIGLKIMGEVELAFILGKGKFIGITGTNGKTTTTALTGEIFRQAGQKVEVVGNIGSPVIEKILTSHEDTWLITELSSFQLESIETFHPKVSAILNLSPDHLDRHGNLENYIEAKKNIYKNQCSQDLFVYNFDDKECRKIAKDVPSKAIGFSKTVKVEIGAYVYNNIIFIVDEEGKNREICNLNQLKIKGWHNIENALAATVISYFCGIDIMNIKLALANFPGVAHRQEYIGEIDGVSFVNDSKGTNPQSSIKALESIDGPIILIAGGYDKSSSFDEFVKAIKANVKALVLIGETAEIIKELAEVHGHKAIFVERDMDSAVKQAFALAKTGDTVLLSPACASWDMYEDFEKRGDDFRSKVENLKKQ